MIAIASIITNYDEIVKYNNAVEEYGGVKEAAFHDCFEPKEKIIETEFLFDVYDVCRSWVNQNGKIVLDFGEESIWIVKNDIEVMNKLKERFKQ